MSFGFLQMITKTKKIFVGGLSASTTVDDMKNYFEQYGKVSEVDSWGRTHILAQSRVVFELLGHSVDQIGDPSMRSGIGNRGIAQSMAGWSLAWITKLDRLPINSRLSPERK